MTSMPIQSVSETSKEEIIELFEAQKKHQYNVANTTYRQRNAKLTKLYKAIFKYREEIREALFNDFKKHPSEVDITEIYPVTSEIKHTKSELRRWMDKQDVATPMALLGSNSYIHQEPKGVVLIISPWNFPVNLTFVPLVSAIAAGNTVILKPSEMTPNSAMIMQKIIDETFDRSEVAMVQGGIPTSTALLALPFNHIFFTGSPMVGKIVMAAAAKHLTSVTLELGGKSPTIVDETANIDLAAKRIAVGKWANNGQICIAPDYAFVHESKLKEFNDSLKKHLSDFYGSDASKSGDYARIVNEKHHSRLTQSLEGTLDQGGKVIYGGDSDPETAYLGPTLVVDAPMDSELMTDEIFGPILPIHGYKSIDDVLDFIKSREKPLALYIYSRNKKKIDYIMKNSRAGGTCINQNSIHYFNTNLPFGGSNNSGIGKAGGWYGFQEFSNARGVLKQNIPNALDILPPPFTSFKQKLIDLTLKWF